MPKQTGYAIHCLNQGSQEWHQHRARCFNASEAAAMMGDSKYLDQGTLILQKAGQVSEDIPESKRWIFERGHTAEKFAMPIVEAMLETDLSPVVASLEIDGMTLGASFDGISMDGAIVWENKLFSKRLSAIIATGELTPDYYWQLEQQLFISGADEVFFTCCDGTPDKFSFIRYQAQPGRIERLLDGWRNFSKNLHMFKKLAVALDGDV